MQIGEIEIGYEHGNVLDDVNERNRTQGLAVRSLLSLRVAAMLIRC